MTAKDNVYRISQFMDEESDELEETILANQTHFKMPNMWMISVSVMMMFLVALVVFMNHRTSRAESQLQESEAQLDEMSLQVSTAESSMRESKASEADALRRAIDAESQNSDLELELSEANDRISLMVEPEVAIALESSNAQLVAELAEANSQIAVQEEVVEQLQVNLETIEELNKDLQAQAEAARTEVYRAQAAETAEGIRSADALAQLSIAHDMVVSRAQATLVALGRFDLSSKVYNLGQVRHEIVRHTFFWDDEAQIFTGTGEIRFLSRMEKTKVSLVDSNTIQVVLPLPVVDEAKHVALDGTITTEREQAARWGARWGEQTEELVDVDAQEKTRTLACQDVAALRREMIRVLDLAQRMTNGYSLDVRWVDSRGSIRTTVTDAQLLASAC